MTAPTASPAVPPSAADAPPPPLPESRSRFGWVRRTRNPVADGRRHGGPLLWVILLLAAALRVWGLGFGLPNTVARPDEGRVIKTAAGFTYRHSLDPDFFAYPTLFMYVVGSLYAGRCAASVAAGAYPSIDACAAAWCHDWGRLVLVARSVSALAGVAGVAAVAAIGRRLHPAAGICSAALLAVAFLHVRDSHFAVTDVAMTSMVLLAVLALLRAEERPSAPRFALAGLVAGLATSTKYGALMLGAPAVASQVRAWLWPRDVEPARHTRLILFSAGAAVGFFVGTPYALVSWSELVEAVSSESAHLLGGHRVGLVGRLDVGWRHHALVTLPQGLGWALYLAGVAGIAWSFVARLPGAVTIFAFPLVFYLFAGRGHTVFARYMIPVVPFLCLGAGALIAITTERLTQHRRAAGRAVTIALLAVFAVPTGWKSVQLDRLLARTDSRVLAADWITNNVKPGASILDLSYGLMLWRGCDPPPYDVWNDPGRVTGPTRERPDWIVIEESPLPYSAYPENVKPVLEEYALAHVVRAVNRQEWHVYDRQDAFYLPLNGLDRVLRPGPNIYVYAKTR